MDSHPTAADPKHQYHSSPWTHASSSTSTPTIAPLPLADPSSLIPIQLPPRLDFIPVLFPHHPSLYQAQLLQYNKLVAPGRGGGSGFQTTSVPVPAIVSSPLIQPAPRSRPPSKSSSNKDSQPQAKSTAQNCHGNRGAKNQDKTDSAVMISGKEPAPPPKMAGKKPSDASNSQTSKAAHQASRAIGNAPAQSSSVPSTPHQHARKFSFESREPSPNAAQNHSPRSAYSETNSTLPSLRPLPPRLGGCKYETGLVHSRRRMPYSLGGDRLETTEPEKIKSKLSEDEERQLDTDMRELYDRLLPTAAIEENRQKLVTKLKKIFNEEWPGHNIEVHLFGSSGNLLCSDDSDVDICITTEWKELEGVCMIAELLAKHGMRNVVCVSSAKVPIVKIWDPELGLACDMNVNNTLALENTRMVRTYVEIDERVRPLAMIIKYWTRRRIVNDAAFGGTLSSYTWMCMIIIFLQLRKPPVLPALHQQLANRLPVKDGRRSAFADDLNKVRGFGKENKESLATLLFHFFRFYAHEFDYDKLALSVRLGKTISKTDKKWHLSLNNMLCVEEPFNTARNLGNTADDTSFRGLHLELRRAFDLIADAKLEECCEQFVFPKEEERIWQKPPPVPRPVLVRSSSQTHSGRGGRGGGFRGSGRQFHRNANNNRRASSSVAYDNSSNNATNVAGFVPGTLPPTPLVARDVNGVWYQAHQPQPMAFHQDLFGNTLTALQMQEHSLRFQLYTQSQAYAQQAALAHAQRMQSGPAQPTDRSRTNSLENPPLSAPIRQPDMYLYGFPMQAAPFFPQASITSYPSSPSASATAPEFRRSLHRATVTGESGAATSTASLRSQSQPASRSSGAQTQALPAFPPAPAVASSVLPELAARHGQGVAIPSFIADENNDSEYEEPPPRPRSESPPEDDEPRYIGYCVGESTSPARTAQQPVPHAIPAFGDLVQDTPPTRRRLSTDQLPQSVLDRRMRRTGSRSPSPLRHARAFSVGTSSAPLSSAPFPPAAGIPNALSRNRPLVVNGSATIASSAASSSRQASTSESVNSDDSGFDNALHIHPGLPVVGEWRDRATVPTPKSAHASPRVYDQPLVVNGTANVAGMSPSVAGPEPFGRGGGFISGQNNRPFVPAVIDGFNSSVSPITSRQLRALSRQQSNGIAPLDLAVNEYSAPGEQHLSPVYEARTPSPTVRRKLEAPLGFESKPTTTTGSGLAKEKRVDGPGSKANQRAQGGQQSQARPENGSGSSTGSPRVNGVPNRVNGYPASGRAEGDISGGWQKTKSRKKTNDLKIANGFPQSEQLPKNDADRKGG